MRWNSVILFVVSSVLLFGQEGGRWVKGSAAAYGTDFSAMRTEAVKRARADALNQAGIVVSASSYRLQTETNKGMNDYYSQFTEATSRGIITAERNITVSEPVRVTGGEAGDERIYQVEARLEAYVVVPDGNADPSFTVRMQSERTSYREGEPVVLSITASKAGYLTILHVKNDTMQVLFPNPLNKNSKVRAGSQILFPKEFDLELTVDRGETSTEEFIAVVTASDSPVAAVGDAVVAGGELVLPRVELTQLSRWLAGIPLHQRCMDHLVLTAVK